MADKSKSSNDIETYARNELEESELDDIAVSPGVHTSAMGFECKSGDCGYHLNSWYLYCQTTPGTTALCCSDKCAYDRNWGWSCRITDKPGYTYGPQSRDSCIPNVPYYEEMPNGAVVEKYE